MRFLYIVIIVASLFGLYLNRTYAAFFNNINVANLKAPTGKTEFDLGNQTGTKETVLFIGDSLTAGVGATEEKNILGYRVTERLAGNKSVKLINLGVPGAKVQDLVQVSEQYKEIKSNVSVIFIGINDVFNRTPMEEFHSDLEKVITNLQFNKTKVVLVTIPFLGTSKSVPFPFPFFYRYQLHQYNDEIKSIALNHNLQLIDLNKIAFGKLDDPILFAADNFHPSDSGYILLADIIWNELRK